MTNEHRKKILFVFQDTKLFSGTTTAYLKINEVIKNNTINFFTLPVRDELYDSFLSIDEKKRVLFIPNNANLKNKVDRFLALYRYIKSNNIDIIMHSYNFDSPIMVALKLITDVKLVYYFGAERLNWDLRLYSHFYDKYLILSEKIRLSSLERTRKLEHIPFSKNVFGVVDVSLFNIKRMGNWRTKNNEFAGNKIKLGYMGRIDLNKGLLELVEALWYLESYGIDASLDIMGGITPKKQRDKDSIVDLANKLALSDKINFISPSYNNADKAKFFENIDIFCLPSYSEGSPIVVLEAISYLVPVLATKVGTLPLYFEDGRDIMFVKQKDSRDIAGKILEFVNNKELYKRLILGMDNFITKVQNMNLREQLINVFTGI